MPVVIKQTTKIPLFANANKKILEGGREFSGKKNEQSAKWPML